jgi:arylsulfatase A-like enzyme
VPEKAKSKYVHAMPDFMQHEKAMPRVRWQLRFSDAELYQKMVKNYYRLITGVDAVIGNIRQKLDDLGYANNTIIALMGDNGFFLGEYGFAGKWYGHEESIRVPLVFYDPRAPKNLRGQHRHEIALNIDVAPTLVDLAGLPIAHQVQGQSLKPLLQGQSPQWRQEFLYEHLFKVPEESVDRVGYIPSSVGVRTINWKYLRYIDYAPVYEELYDLENDPHEVNNLANNPRCSAQLDRLRQKCDAMMQEKA